MVHSAVLIDAVQSIGCDVVPFTSQLEKAGAWVW